MDKSGKPKRYQGQIASKGKIYDRDLFPGFDLTALQDSESVNPRSIKEAIVPKLLQRSDVEKFADRVFHQEEAALSELESLKARATTSRVAKLRLRVTENLVSARNRDIKVRPTNS